MESIVTDLNKERQKLGLSELKKEELLTKFKYNEMLKELESLKAQSQEAQQPEPNNDDNERQDANHDEIS